MLMHLGLWIVITSAVAQTAAPRQPPYPVRWEAKVGPPDRAALEAQLKQRPRGLEPDDALDNHDEKGDNHPIRTCADYAKAKKAGWSAENNSQGATESFFIGGCDVIELLLKAKPSRVSYVGDLKMDRTAFDILPPSIADMPEDSAALEKAEAGGKSLRQYMPEMEVRKGDPGHLFFGDDESLYDIEIMGYGDFNGDGVEDVLLFQGSYAAHGSMHIYEPVILTRTRPSGLLHIVTAK